MASARFSGMTTCGFSAVTISTWIAIATVWHSLAARVRHCGVRLVDRVAGHLLDREGQLEERRVVLGVDRDRGVVLRGRAGGSGAGEQRGGEYDSGCEASHPARHGEVVVGSCGWVSGVLCVGAVVAGACCWSAGGAELPVGAV